MNDIIEGAVYIYTCGLPVGCHGHRYRVLRVGVMDVPNYQKKVLVEALTGPDAGLWFVCSEENFRVRYQPEGQG